MIAPMTPELFEALATLEKNRYFLEVRKWINECAQKSLESTRFSDDAPALRFLSEYHALTELNEAIEKAPTSHMNNGN